MRTVPDLLALAFNRHAPGDCRCFYCGAACTAEHTAERWVSKSFTTRDNVCGGEHVCAGCVIALDEHATIVFPDGSERENQKRRGYSWVITAEHAIGATKSHIAWLRKQCLSPPTPPFAIVISDSGQKHLLYRGVVCRSASRVALTLEGERIDYSPPELTSRIDLCKRIVAATGKPALAEPLSFNAALRVASHHGRTEDITLWSHVREQPLSRLAAWLCPNKEDCLVEFPAPAA